MNCLRTPVCNRSIAVVYGITDPIRRNQIIRDARNACHVSIIFSSDESIGQAATL